MNERDGLALSAGSAVVVLACCLQIAGSQHDAARAWAFMILALVCCLPMLAVAVSAYRSRRKDEIDD